MAYQIWNLPYSKNSTVWCICSEAMFFWVFLILRWMYHFLWYFFFPFVISCGMVKLLLYHCWMAFITVLTSCCFQHISSCIYLHNTCFLLKSILLFSAANFSYKFTYLCKPFHLSYLAELALSEWHQYTWTLQKKSKILLVLFVYLLEGTFKQKNQYSNVSSQLS